MTWENDKESGRETLTTGLSLNSAAYALSAAHYQRSPSTTSTDVRSSIPKENGQPAYPSTGEKPRKANFKSYAKPATRRKVVRARTTARTTTASSICSRSRRRQKTNPFSHRPMLPCAQSPKRTPRSQQPTVRRTQMAPHSKGQRQNEATTTCRAVHAEALAIRSGQNQAVSKPVHGRTHSTPSLLLPDRLRMGGI